MSVTSKQAEYIVKHNMVNTQEAMEILGGITRNGVYKVMERGKIRAKNFGGHNYFYMVELLMYNINKYQHKKRAEPKNKKYYNPVEKPHENARLERAELLKEFLESGLNMSQFAKEKGVSKQAINQRLNRAIKDKKELKSCQ